MDNTLLISDDFEMDNTLLISDDFEMDNTLLISDDFEMDNTLLISDDFEMDNNSCCNEELAALFQHIDFLKRQSSRGISFDSGEKTYWDGLHPGLYATLECEFMSFEETMICPLCCFDDDNNNKKKKKLILKLPCGHRVHQSCAHPFFCSNKHCPWEGCGNMIESQEFLEEMEDQETTSPHKQFDSFDALINELLPTDSTLGVEIEYEGVTSNASNRSLRSCDGNIIIDEPEQILKKCNELNKEISKVHQGSLSLKLKVNLEQYIATHMETHFMEEEDFIHHQQESHHRSLSYISLESSFFESESEIELPWEAEEEVEEEEEEEEEEVVKFKAKEEQFSIFKLKKRLSKSLKPYLRRNTPPVVDECPQVAIVDEISTNNDNNENEYFIIYSFTITSGSLHKRNKFENAVKMCSSDPTLQLASPNSNTLYL